MCRYEREQDPSADYDPMDAYDRWCDNEREWMNEYRMEAEMDAAANDPTEREAL